MRLTNDRLNLPASLSFFYFASRYAPDLGHDITYAWYNAQTVNIFVLAGFHARYESIHPFQDGNGRTGRLILFRECMVNDMVPFIIKNENRVEYLNALTSYKKNADIELLASLFVSEQKDYEEKCRYFM